MALEIMLACDQAPKAGMPLSLPLVVQMTQMMGRTTLPASGEWIICGVALLWSANAQYLYFAKDQRMKAWVTGWVRYSATAAPLMVP